ncbi:tyrosine-type recombinase/integrase, partial [Plebeiibacterium sediminum]
FKHLVYGLRAMFSMFKNEELLLALPPIKSSKALPVVLSQQEVKTLLKTPKLLKHRILFAIVYDCGLRISEVLNLKIEDLDFDRKQIHIKQSKHKKDRYVPMSNLMIR